MKENIHDIDKLFKAALDDHRENAPEAVWDAIDKSLDKNKVIDINRKYIKVKRIAIALLVLLIGAGAFTLLTFKTTGRRANNYTNTSTKNKEQSIGQNNLVQSKTKQDKITETTVISANENPGVNEAASGTVTTIQKQSEKSIAKDATKEIIKQEEKIEKKLEKVIWKSKNKLKQSADNNNYTAFSKTAKQTENENSINIANRKVTAKKGSQKTSIISGDYGEVENKNVQTGLQNSKEVTTWQPEVIPLINPEIIKPIASRNSVVISINSSLINSAIKQSLPAKKKNKITAPSFAATVFFAPNISSNNIKDEKHEHRPGSRPDTDDMDRIREAEQHQNSNTFGVQLDYNINKHWSLLSGVSLTNKTILIKPKTIYADKDDNGTVKYLYNCSSGYAFLSSKSVANPVVGDSLRAFESTNRLQYLSIPLAVKYTWTFNKIDLFTSVGAAVNILTKGKLETEIEDGLNKQATVSNKINGLKSFYVGGNLSFGTAYNFNENFALSFTPVFNFALASSTKDAAVKTYPNSIGLAVGIRYKL